MTYLSIEPQTVSLCNQSEKIELCTKKGRTELVQFFSYCKMCNTALQRALEDSNPRPFGP